LVEVAEGAGAATGSLPEGFSKNLALAELELGLGY